MMLFEEFFKKKKINLVALNEADAGLFSEFKDHYEQMGEKSFDHTKKYWFNKLRRRYPLPAEPKVEKFKAENQIAEQTVSDTLTEPTPRDKAPDLSKVEPPVNEQATPAAPAPKLGFKPKFKTAATPQPPANEAPVSPPENTETPIAAEPAASTAPKHGFKPRFKAGVTAAAKPNEESTDAPQTEEAPAANTETPTNEIPAATPPKMGFKPRFKAGVTPTTKPAEENAEAVKPDTAPAEPEDKPPIEASATAPAKMGFTPRFKAGVTNTKSAEEAAKLPEPQEAMPEVRTETQAEQPAPAKLGFKPRFKAGVTTTKPVEEQVQPQATEAKEEAVTANEPPAQASADEPESPAPKPAYKPRFTPNMIKRKPPEEE